MQNLPQMIVNRKFTPLLTTNRHFISDRDDSKYGYDSDGQNFYLKLYHEFQKMVLISLKDLCEIDIFPKFHRCGSKIVPAMPI